MENLGYLDRILAEYERSFDIHREYEIGDKKIEIYFGFDTILGKKGGFDL